MRQSHRSAVETSVIGNEKEGKRHLCDAVHHEPEGRDGPNEHQGEGNVRIESVNTISKFRFLNTIMGLAILLWHERKARH